MKKVTKLEKSIEEQIARYGEKLLFSEAEYNRDNAEDGGYSNYSYWRSTWRSFTRNRVAMFFMYLLIAVLLFTIIQPMLPNQKDHNEIFWVGTAPDMNHRPDSEFWFGTNSTGQDLWSRIWHGTRTSLLIGIVVGFCNAFIGILIGALWGYVRMLDRFLTEVYNVLHNIPNSIVLILVSYILKPGVGTMIFAMCVMGWLPMCRFVRNQIVIIRDQEYNLASRCLGTPTFRMITKNLLPTIKSSVVYSVVICFHLQKWCAKCGGVYSRLASQRVPSMEYKSNCFFGRFDKFIKPRTTGDITSGNGIVAAVREHICPNKALPRTCETVCVEESAHGGVVIAGLEVIEAGFGIVVIAAVTEGILLSHTTRAC